MTEQRRHATDEIVCAQLVELATDHLERALPEDRAQLVEEHLVLCASCKLYLDQMQATIGAMAGSAPLDEPDPDAELGLLTAFREWRDGS